MSLNPRALPFEPVVDSQPTFVESVFNLGREYSIMSAQINAQRMLMKEYQQKTEDTQKQMVEEYQHISDVLNERVDAQQKMLEDYKHRSEDHARVCSYDISTLDAKIEHIQEELGRVSLQRETDIIKVDGFPSQSAWELIKSANCPIRVQIQTTISTEAMDHFTDVLLECHRRLTLRMY